MIGAAVRLGQNLTVSGKRDCGCTQINKAFDLRTVLVRLVKSKR